MQVYNYLNTPLHPAYTLAVHHLLPGEPQPGTWTTSSGQPATPSSTSVPWATIFLFHEIVSVCQSINCMCLYTHVMYMWDMCIFVWSILSVQFSSVSQSCPTLSDPMNCSIPCLPVHHQLPEFTQTHVHRVSDAIQPSHPLSSPSPPAPNPSQHQSLFQCVNSSHEVAKVLEFQL